MSSVKVNILARVPYTDHSNPTKPLDKVSVTFQLPPPDNRVSSIDIPAFDAGKPAEDLALATKIKSMGSALQEQKEIKL